MLTILASIFMQQHAIIMKIDFGGAKVYEHVHCLFQVLGKLDLKQCIENVLTRWMGKC